MNHVVQCIVRTDRAFKGQEELAFWALQFDGWTVNLDQAWRGGDQDAETVLATVTPHPDATTLPRNAYVAEPGLYE